MKQWEKWIPVKDLFMNPERVAMLAVRCPTCDGGALTVQIRAERPPYVMKCRLGHQWSVLHGVATPFKSQ